MLYVLRTSADQTLLGEVRFWDDCTACVEVLSKGCLGYLL